MIPVVTPERMKAVDQAADAPVDVLIERAGAAVANAVRRVLGGTYGRRVIVVAGPGNNGADGRVAARRLAADGVSVRVFQWDECPAVLPPSDLVVDAAFGTGFRGRWVLPDTSGAPIVAVDVPTGLDALSGVAVPGTAAAVATVTFAAAKPGHVLGVGPDLVGELTVADIGLDLGVPDDGTPPIGIVTAADVAAWLPARERDAHKWSHAVRVVAGSPGMEGAAWLACAAAQRAGAGIVVLSPPGGAALAPVETVVRPIAIDGWDEEVLDDLHRSHALVIGPGLGRDQPVLEAVPRIIRDALVPVVVDGDALYAIARVPGGLAAALHGREIAAVVTPHDGEFERLAGGRPGADRLTAVRWLAEQCGCTVLLKGPTTIVADPSGPTYLVDHGDQRLATAGSGDVLSGIIGAFIARGLDVPRAAAAAAWVHAEAGRRRSAVGLVAADLVDGIPAAIEGAS